MRLAVLLVLLLALPLLAQDVPAAPAPSPLADQLSELLATVLALAVAGLVAAVRGWLRAKLQRDAVIAGVEKGGDEATKVEIQRITDRAGVEIDKPMIEKATKKMERLTCLLPFFLCALLLAGCGLSADSVRALQDDARDWKAVSEETGSSAALGASDWSWWILFELGEVDELPPDVRARLEAHRARRAR